MDAPSSCLCLPTIAAAADAAPGKAACQNEESSSSSSFHAATATTATESLAPEIKQQQQKQQHPLLLRHFFTIGIGDVFVQPPDHPLPSVYLSSPSSAAASTSTSSSSSTGVFVDDNNFTFESTELVAAIKSTPQDFVVREMGLPNRAISGLNETQVESMMRVATLDGLPNCSSSSSSSSSNAPPPTPAMQAVDDSLLIVDDDGKGNGNSNSRRYLSDEKLTQQQQQPTRYIVQQAPAVTAAATAGQSEKDNSKSRALALDPVSTLQKFLPRYNADESSSTTTPNSSTSSLDDLARLQADAVEWIQNRAARSSSNNQAIMHDDDNDDKNDTGYVLSRSVVIRPLLGSDPESCSSSNSTRIERGEFHNALRLAFPLLKVESAEETKLSSSSSCGGGVDVSSSSICSQETSAGMPNAIISHYYEVKVIVDDSFFELVPYLYEPHIDVPRLYQFLRNRRHHDSDSDEQQQVSSSQPRQSKQSSNTRNGNNNNNNNSSHSRLLYLRLRPDLDRSERRPVHQIIDSKSGRSLSTETLPTYPLHPDDQESCTLVTAAIIVSWSKTAQRRACKNESKKRKRAGPPPPTTSDNGDNNTANDVTSSSAVDHNPNLLFILKKTQVEHLAAIQLLSKALHCRQPDIGLSGIKDMQAVTYQFCTIRKNHATKTNLNIRQQARDFLQSRGVEISQNVYHVDWSLHKGALQGNRFEIVLRNVRRIRVSQPTTTAATTEESYVPCDADYIQEAVKRIETFGILNFYGEQRVGAAGDVALVGTRALDIGRAMLQQDYAKAIDLIMTGRILCKGGTERERDEVRLVRQTWKDSGGDPFVTWKKLPPCESSLLLRERLVLRGLKRYGKTEPLAALKCLQYNERVFWIQAYQSYVFNRAVTEHVQKYGMQVVPGDLVRSRQHGNHSSGSDSEPPVVIVTECNLTQYSIEDVVLPLPGYNSVYPTNEVGRLYQAILEADKIVFRKDALPETTAKGSYRYLKASVTNVKSEILNRDDSGLDLHIWFDLPAGSYATMVLRELMRTTVSRRIGDSIVTTAY